MEWQKIITILAGAYNFTIIVPTRGFTNKSFFQVDPDLFDIKGCLMVLLWGATHISVAWDYASIPYLYLVFCFEKLFYIVHWMTWLRKRNQWADLPQVKGDVLANGFFHLYGLGDVFFGSAFLVIFIKGVSWWYCTTDDGYFCHWISQKERTEERGRLPCYTVGIVLPVFCWDKIRSCGKWWTGFLILADNIMDEWDIILVDVMDACWFVYARTNNNKRKPLFGMDRK